MTTITKTRKDGSTYEFHACDRDGKVATRRMKDEATGMELDVCKDCAYRLQTLSGFRFIDGFPKETLEKPTPKKRQGRQKREEDKRPLVGLEKPDHAFIVWITNLQGKRQMGGWVDIEEGVYQYAGASVATMVYWPQKCFTFQPEEWEQIDGRHVRFLYMIDKKENRLFVCDLDKIRDRIGRFETPNGDRVGVPYSDFTLHLRTPTPAELRGD